MPKIEAKIVEVLCFRRRGTSVEILVLKRAKGDKLYPGLWQVVSGMIRRGESAVSAALRECREETGLRPKELWTLPMINGFLSPATDTIHLHPTFAAEVESGAIPTLSGEHQEFRWLSPIKARTLLLWPGSHRAVQVLVDHLLRVPELRERTRVVVKTSNHRKERV